jgi:hypothetical protein
VFNDLPHVYDGSFLFVLFCSITLIIYSEGLKIKNHDTWFFDNRCSLVGECYGLNNRKLWLNSRKEQKICVLQTVQNVCGAQQASCSAAQVAISPGVKSLASETEQSTPASVESSSEWNST